MIGALVLLVLGILLTASAVVLAVLTTDPLIKGPLTAVLLAFLLPGSLLLSVNVSRVIESIPSKTTALERLGMILGTPRVLFGVLILAAGLALPFAVLRDFSLGVVRGEPPLLRLAGLFIAPMLIFVGYLLIRRGAGIPYTPARRIRIAFWEMNEFPFHVRVLLLACALALGTSMLGFSVGMALFELGTAKLVWQPVTSVTLLVVSVPLAVFILRRRGAKERKSRERQR